MHSAIPVDDVIIPLAPSRGGGDLSAERSAFLSVSDALARSPQGASQRLVEVAMRLSGADAAGISLEEPGAEHFRWIAVAGEFERYLNGTMPRFFSPCGTVLDRGQTLVMRDPLRAFPYIDRLHVPQFTVLLVPFSRKGRLIGTIWVMSKDLDHVFTVDDARVVQQLTTFSSSIVDALESGRSRAN